MDLVLHPRFAQNRTIWLYVLTDAGALLRIEPAQ